MNSIFLLVVVFCANFIDSAKLPLYFKPCLRGDPNLNECARQHAQDSFQHFTKTGDRKYNIPIIEPLSIIELEVNHGGLDLIFSDMIISGLSEAEMKAVRIDQVKQHEEFDLYVPHLMVISKYKAKGKVLIMPVQGDGDCNVTIVGVQVTLSHDYTLGAGKTGADHMTMFNTKLVFTPKRAYFTFGNMFNGDKRLSDVTNMFLNENWKEIVDDIGPSVAHALSAVAAQIYSGIAAKVPYHDIYPESA